MGRLPNLLRAWRFAVAREVRVRTRIETEFKELSRLSDVNSNEAKSEAAGPTTGLNGSVAVVDPVRITERREEASALTVVVPGGPVVVEVELTPLAVRRTLPPSPGQIESRRQQAGFWRGVRLFSLTVVLPMLIGSLYLIVFAAPRFASSTSFIVRAVASSAPLQTAAAAAAAIGQQSVGAVTAPGRQPVGAVAAAGQTTVVGQQMTGGVGQPNMAGAGLQSTAGGGAQSGSTMICQDRPSPKRRPIRSTPI